MEAFCERLTDCFLRHKLIDSDQVLWCRYMLMRYTMEIVSLVWLIPVGALVHTWYTSAAFVLSYRFLRVRTGGYHAKTPIGCICASTSVQLLALWLVSVFPDQPALLIAFLTLLSCAGIVVMAPANHAKLHLSDKEVRALIPRIRIRLLVLCGLTAAFYFIFPKVAVSICLGVVTTALLLFICKIGIGVE